MLSTCTRSSLFALVLLLTGDPRTTARALSGFGVVFSVEPRVGSCAGGTELHIAGTGFASVQKVLVGGKECQIFDPITKDGELLCFSPPGNDREWVDVELIFSSGHIARWNRQYRCQRWDTPRVMATTAATPLMGNVSFFGDFLRELEANQREIFAITGEKRNATETMHAYLGKGGRNLMASKGGIGEYRCDLLETKTRNYGTCEAKAGMPSGYYNFSYNLEADNAGGRGYGMAEWKYGKPSISLPSAFGGAHAGRIYAVEVFPTIHAATEKAAGHLGGTRMTVFADGLTSEDGGLFSPSDVHVTAAGVPCDVEKIERAGNYEAVTCVLQAVAARGAQHPGGEAGFGGLAPSPLARDWKSNLSRSLSPGLYDYPTSTKRSGIDMADNVELLYPKASCITNPILWWNNPNGKANYGAWELLDCAEECFRIGNCTTFMFRPTGHCAWCFNLETEAVDETNVELESQMHRRRRWHSWTEDGGGIYKLKTTGNQFLEQNAEGPTWSLVSATSRCAGGVEYLWGSQQNELFHGASIQVCADACAAYNRLDSHTGRCEYFGIKKGTDGGSSRWSRCVLYKTETAGCELLATDVANEREWSGRVTGWATYRLKRPLPFMPPPTGLYPGGRGVLYRVWNACPKSNTAFNNGCMHNELQHPFAALYASLNPEYEAQRPMFEGVRSDQLRGPYGSDSNGITRWNIPEEMYAHDRTTVPFDTLHDAMGDHGLVFEIMGFFVAPFTANYSFLQWGAAPQDFWMSEASEDPTALVLLSDSIYGQACSVRNGDPNRWQTVVGCEMFEGVKAPGSSGYDGRRDKIGAELPGGTRRTSTIQSVALQAGERRFFVKRVSIAEKENGASHRRRRSHYEGMGVRIHKPDVSSMSAAAVANVKRFSSMPEVFVATRPGSCSGMIKLGLTIDGEKYESSPLKCGFSKDDLQKAWSSVLLPSGQFAFADVWDAGSNAYMVTSWLPAGPLALTWDTSEAGGAYKVEVETLIEGDSDDIMVTSIPGAWLEAPSTVPVVQLSAKGMPARHAQTPLTAAEIADLTEGASEEEAEVAVARRMQIQGGNFVSSFDYSNLGLDGALPGSPVCSGAPPAFRYYRLTVKSVNSDTTIPAQTRFAEINFWTAGANDGAGVLHYLTGATVTANDTIDSSRPIGHLVDGDLATEMRGTGSGPALEINIDLGAGNEKAVELFSFASSGQTWARPSTWLLEGSDTGSSAWVAVHNQEYGETVKTTAQWQIQSVFRSQLSNYTCGATDASGCGWGRAFALYPNCYRDSDCGERGTPQIYGSWQACQQRCCFDAQCRFAAYNKTSGECRIFRREPDSWLQPAEEVMSASLTSRADSTDGFAVMDRPPYDEGVPLTTFSGHRSVTFCKKECAKNAKCNSFSWDQDHGCVLWTGCLEAEMRRTSHWWKAANAMTFYKTSPQECDYVRSLSHGGLNELLKTGNDTTYLPSVQTLDNGRTIETFGLDATEEDVDAMATECYNKCAAQEGCTSWAASQVRRRREKNSCWVKKDVDLPGQLRTNFENIVGFVQPMMEALPKPMKVATMQSALRDAFASADVASPALAAAAAMGFAFLPKADSPAATAIKVDGSSSTSMASGNTVVLEGTNFDGVEAEDVEVRIGDVFETVSSITPTAITFSVQGQNQFAVLPLSVRLGSKGWLDFEGVASAGPGSASLSITLGGGAPTISTVSPRAASIHGGGVLTIEGEGFSPKLDENTVELQDGGSWTGNCTVTAASYTSLECTVPARDAESAVTLLVNDVAAGTFNYAAASTPQVTALTPASLSFATSGDISITGSGFGSDVTGVTVTFGSGRWARSCTVKDVSDTSLTCQLLRSALQFPPICTDIADVHKMECIVQAPVLVVEPTVIVSSNGLAAVQAGVELDTRFEIHSVSPNVGSEEGGTTVTVSGTGFSSAAVTSQRSIAAIGTFGDIVSWTNTDIVFTTRKAQLNAKLIDIDVNLIRATHKCGTGNSDGDCKFEAVGKAMTPEVTAVSPKTARRGDSVQIDVTLPTGVSPTAADVTVKLGDHTCASPSVASAGSDAVRITCTMPEFEASTVPLSVHVEPLGYAKVEGDLAVFSSELAITSVTPDRGSMGGQVVTISGVGFAAEPARHFVKVGDRWHGLCDPISSSYTELTCQMNWEQFDLDRAKTDKLEDIQVMLWDVEVSDTPLAAFGSENTGCFRVTRDWSHWGIHSLEECALTCLYHDGCRSFNYRPRYTRCELSKQSKTNCPSCAPWNREECKYMERRDELRPHVVATATKTEAYTYDKELTPDIEKIFMPMQASLSTKRMDSLPVEDTGCGADHADLADGNGNCCFNRTQPCSWGEGSCRNSDECGGQLTCMSWACSWSYQPHPDLPHRRRRGVAYKDNCCVLEALSYRALVPEPAWRAGDEIVFRSKRLGTGDPTQYYATNPTVQEAFANPGNGYLNATVGGVDCPVKEFRMADKDDVNANSRFVDIAVTLGNAPGGLYHYPMLHVEGMGSAFDEDMYVQLPLIVSSVEAADASYGAQVGASTLGGGWELKVSGLGFAPTEDEEANAFVEVAVCGKRCEVTSSSYEAVTCTVPRVFVPSIFGSELQPVAPRLLTQDAGLLAGSDATLLPPMCFYGNGDHEYITGHPTCVAAFDGDSELVAGTSGQGCYVGVDFGAEQLARVESIRFFPRYSTGKSAEQYVNAKFQVGVLDEVAHAECDELTYGWRGKDYRGCQNVDERGEACVPWSTLADHKSWQYWIETNPELLDHNYCRNFRPMDWTSPFCVLENGKTRGCRPKPPAVTWTDVYTIQTLPKMLWNTVKLKEPQLVRFVRFLGVGGECRMTEMEVHGNIVAAEDSCKVLVRNVRRSHGPGHNAYIARPDYMGQRHMRGREWSQMASEWASSSNATITFNKDETPVINFISPMNGTARGGTEVTLSGVNFGSLQWTESDGGSVPATVTFNSYDCRVTAISSTEITCVTAARDQGIKAPSTVVEIAGIGEALVRPGVNYRYLDRWSDPRTWKDNEMPLEGDLVVVPAGQAIMLDMNTPKLHTILVMGVLVWDYSQDLEMTAQNIWVKGGTFEIGTEDRPFYNKATITLWGEKYEAVRLPVIGAKMLAVSNDQFTIREKGDGATEPGAVGTLDIHGAPRLKVWTRLAETAEAGATTIKVQEDVDFAPGEVILLVATETPPKEMHGEGLHGAPPVHFEDETVVVESLGADKRTITLRAPGLKYRHIATSYTRPDGEYVDLSGEVALLTRNVKIQGDDGSDLYMWGGHSLVAFGGVYRVENAEWYRMGQTGEMSRYPIHFHVSQEWGQYCYAKYNSIHHSFQRAITIHSTEYALVKGNVAYDIIGHMYFVETGMERFNVLEGNLGVGAIPLLSGMLESDQEPAAFWTAAPNNVWRDNVAATGSDGWYFQLPDSPISHSMDVYDNSICPVHDRIGEWSRNRCHHTTGSCIRIYLTWIPHNIPCNSDSGEAPQILFNTTCWGVGAHCFSGMKIGAVLNHHLTAVEGKGVDIFYGIFHRQGSYSTKMDINWLGEEYPLVKDSVVVGLLPENLKEDTPRHYKASGLEMPQGENFYVNGLTFVNLLSVPAMFDCSLCWTVSHWRPGAFTYRLRNLSFINSSKRLFVYKQGIYWDLDGTLTGVPDSYTTWADPFNQDADGCDLIDGLTDGEANTSMVAPEMSHSSGGEDTGSSIFHTVTSGASTLHSKRDFKFITCRQPIRRMEVLFPEPYDVILRQLNVTNPTSGRAQQIEYSVKDLWGWTMPVVSETSLEFQLNLLGLDLRKATIRYSHGELLEAKDTAALVTGEPAKKEWFQFILRSTTKFDHYEVINPGWEAVAARRGQDAGTLVKGREMLVEGLEDPTPLTKPDHVSLSLTHSMLSPEQWAITFVHPDGRDSKPPFAQEPYSAFIQAKRCPRQGCTLGLPPLGAVWETPKLWSEVIGTTNKRSEVVIEAEDWILFDMPGAVAVKTVTVFGRLSFDDAADRSLTADSMTVWGHLQLGTKEAPFGQTTGKKVTIALRGSVTDTNAYVYIEELTLHGKVIAVAGRVEAYGAPVASTWGRLEASIDAGATTACLMPSEDGDSLDWPAGAEVAFAPTEFDSPADDVEVVTLKSAATLDAAKGCWSMTWDGGLKKKRYAGDVDIGDGKSVSLRAIAVRLDRTVVFESDGTDGEHKYGGTIEVFDLPNLNPRRTGELDMHYVNFKELGKGGLEGAVVVVYESNFDPPPRNLLHGCSWKNSLGVGLKVASFNAPMVVSSNVMVNSHDGGIWTHPASTGVQIVNNAIVGVSMSPKAPIFTNEMTGLQRVRQLVGIRTDEIPLRMSGNVVAGSNDAGFSHLAEMCGTLNIFDNEAFAVVVGVFLLPQEPLTKSCQWAAKYTVWKAAHIGIFISDIRMATRLSHIVVADAHLGIVPYFSISRNYRRFWVDNATIIGSSPASSCDASQFCRTQNGFDPYMTDCASIYTPIEFRRVGFVVPFNTKNTKTCYSKLDERQCMGLGQGYPVLDDCHMPLEYHNHFDNGMGWSFFEDTTFAYFKKSDCGRTSRAISANPSAAEVQFPTTFKNTRWHEVDPEAKFEFNAEVMDEAYVGRKSPCKFDGAGCMGLDQSLVVDADGTLLGLPGVSKGVVVPFTPRTEIVWSSQCSNELELNGVNVTMDAYLCPEIEVTLLEMKNMDRGAADIKFGPLILNPEDSENNGFGGGVISSVGPFYGSCPCGWDFSFYHSLIKPQATYYAEVVSLPENFLLRFLSPKPTDSVLLQYFYPDSRGVNLFVGAEKKPNLSLALARPPTLADPHGSHLVDAQAKRLYVVLRGSKEAFNGLKDIVIRRTPTVKLKMNVQISLEEFNGDNFVNNVAMLLGIPPERVKVVDVQSRRLTQTEVIGRRLASADSTDLNIQILPCHQLALETTSDGLSAQAAELRALSGWVDASAASGALSAAAGGDTAIEEEESPSILDEISVGEMATAKEVEAESMQASVDTTAVARRKSTQQVSLDLSCSMDTKVVVQISDISGILSPDSEIKSGGELLVPCGNVNPRYEGSVSLKCSGGQLLADAGACHARGCEPQSLTMNIAPRPSYETGFEASLNLQEKVQHGGSGEISCAWLGPFWQGNIVAKCTGGLIEPDASGCVYTTPAPTAAPTPLPPGDTAAPTQVPTAAPTMPPTEKYTPAPTPLPPGLTMAPTPAPPTAVPTAAKVNNAAKITQFTTTVGLEKATDFNLEGYKSVIAKTVGLVQDNVVVTSVKFKLDVKYSFASVSGLTEESVSSTLASLHKVPAADIKVSMPGTARRLQFVAPRELAGSGEVSASISTETAATADSLKASMADAAALGTALSVDAPEVVSAPKLSVDVVTQISSQSDAVVPVPDPASLATSLSEEFKVLVDVGIHHVDLPVKVISVALCPPYNRDCSNTKVPLGARVGDHCSGECQIMQGSGRWCPTGEDKSGDEGTAWGWCECPPLGDCGIEDGPTTGQTDKVSRAAHVGKAWWVAIVLVFSNGGFLLGLS
eukprot:TRINITY_DN5945_c0_g1_i2.p1 TRINITY_DN5945_c0_g1~~TRINITY_DN5945_c0_g1_i2.p1  ORF type:complete len:5466 (+),score=1278.01 TRINITY_DN5945_c0_g1_i2:78-16475(+)